MFIFKNISDNKRYTSLKNMSRYTRSVYDEAINDNDIDTDAYASLLDNDYNTIINEVPAKESDDKPIQ